MTDKTEQEYQDALQAAKGDMDHLRVIEVYIQLGRYYRSDGDTPKGLTQFELALKTALKFGYKEMESRLLGLIGQSLKEIGNYQASMQSYRKSLRIAKKIENSVLQLDSLLHIGMLLAEQGKNLEAISKLDNALALSIQINDLHRKLHVANLMGNIYLAIDSSEKALESYAIALEAARAIKDVLAEAATLIHLGQAFMKDDIFDTAIEHFENALDFSGKVDNPHIEIQALNGLMHANDKLGKQKLAIVYGEQMVNKTKAMGEASIEMQAIDTLVKLLINYEKYQDVVPYLEGGLQISRAQKDRDWELRFLMDHGISLYMVEDHKKADVILNEALDLAVRMQKKPEEAVLLGHLSALKADDGKLDSSIEYSERALDLARQTGNRVLEGEQLVLLSLNYHELDENEKAAAFGEDAIRIFKELENPELVKLAKKYVDSYQLE
jgi:tetratricopeptide (TPR) repeat protein